MQRRKTISTYRHNNVISKLSIHLVNEYYKLSLSTAHLAESNILERLVDHLDIKCMNIDIV